MAKWEYCYVLQYPDDTGVFYFQEGDQEDAKKSSEQNTPSGRQVIDELGRNGWETLSVSAIRDGKSSLGTKPVYKWVLKRPSDPNQPRSKIATD
jgi:hypothetical protein